MKELGLKQKQLLRNNPKDYAFCRKCNKVHIRQSGIGKKHRMFLLDFNPDDLERCSICNVRIDNLSDNHLTNVDCPNV